MGIFGEDARDEGDAKGVQFVSNAVDAEGEEAGVGNDDLLKRFSSGVVAEVASSIFVESFADATEPAEERLRHLFSLGVADQAGDVGVQLNCRIHQAAADVYHLQFVAHGKHPREE